MSLGIIYKGPEGIALAIDSRVTLHYTLNSSTKASQPVITQASYDNATKLLKVAGQEHVAAIAVGLGALGTDKPRTIASFIPEFERELGPNPGRLSVEDFARKLGQFFMKQWNESPPPGKNEQMQFLVAGYNENETYGRIYDIFIPARPEPTELLVNDFGLQWAGQVGIVARIVNGFDGSSMQYIADTMKITDINAITALSNGIKASSALKIPYQFIPLQDGVDLCILLVSTTAQLMKYTTDIRGVGGPIDAATITRVDGFKYIQHKELHGERRGI